LNFDNVTLWFAKTDEDKIITINEINDRNIHNKYYCPMCGSDLIPKATKSKYITEHFAHIDVSKCNNETMIHWWFKNKFLE
jgi:competence CoiA-like predicted nuclease